MNRHTKSDLKELRVFLVALGIAFFAILLMALVLGITWKRVPIPAFDNGAPSGQGPSQ